LKELQSIIHLPAFAKLTHQQKFKTQTEIYALPCHILLEGKGKVCPTTGHEGSEGDV
jgi:hypothetical protein